MMRFLQISICFLLISCGSYPKKQGFQTNTSSSKTFNNFYFSNTNKDYIYKTSIQVYNKNFSGLLIIKKVDKNKHRVAFTTEMGNKLFDFIFSENNFQVNFILEELNKNMLINILKKDFKVLVTENLKNIKSYTKTDTTIFETSIYDKNHYYYFSENQLTQVIRAKNGKEKVQFLFLEINNHLADKILITHQNIKLEIALRSLTQ